MVRWPHGALGNGNRGRHSTHHHSIAPTANERERGAEARRLTAGQEATDNGLARPLGAPDCQTPPPPYKDRRHQ